jgi:hypothetical protein
VPPCLDGQAQALADLAAIGQQREGVARVEHHLHRAAREPRRHGGQEQVHHGEVAPEGAAGQVVHKAHLARKGLAQQLAAREANQPVGKAQPKGLPDGERIDVMPLHGGMEGDAAILSRGALACVITRRTPGTASAAVVSMRRMRPRATVLVTGTAVAKGKPSAAARRSSTGELRRHPDIAQAFYDLGPARTLRNLGAILAEAAERGEVILRVSPDRAAEMLVGIWQGYSNYRLALDIDGPERDPALLDAQVREGVAVFLRGSVQAPD